jgi:flagellar basal-body rod modification protein FlgD
MNIKNGTKTWSTAEQASSFKADVGNNLSAPAMEKELGDQSVGDVLNKVADPNYVDPHKSRRVGNNALDKDAFMKLMLTQMKYQDPTNPMQNHEMAAQLAQFSTLEQMNNMNKTLELMKDGQKPQTDFQALNFVGKMVAGDSSKLVRSNGDKFHDFNFELMNDASEVSVQVKDAEGTVIRTLKATNLKKGQNTVNWNGLNEDGAAARPGEYRFVIEAKNSAGTKLVAKTQFDGKITGLNFTPNGPVLLVGNQTVKLQDVKRIYEPAQGTEQLLPVQKLEAGQTPPLQILKNGAAVKKSDEVPAASDEQTGPVNNLGSGVGMSQGMINKIQKEVAKG